MTSWLCRPASEMKCALEIVLKTPLRETSCFRKNTDNIITSQAGFKYQLGPCGYISLLFFPSQAQVNVTDYKWALCSQKAWLPTDSRASIFTLLNHLGRWFLFLNQDSYSLSHCFLPFLIDFSKELQTFPWAVSSTSPGDHIYLDQHRT